MRRWRRNHGDCCAHTEVGRRGLSLAKIKRYRQLSASRTETYTNGSAILGSGCLLRLTWCRRTDGTICVSRGRNVDKLNCVYLDNVIGSPFVAADE